MASDALERMVSTPADAKRGDVSRQSAVRGGSPSPTPGAALSLASSFRWTLAGNIVNATCQWGMLSVLAHLGDAEAVGQFVLGLSIAAPIMALTMLQLRNVQVTDVSGTYAFADYFGARIFWTLVGVVAIVICATLASDDRITFWVVVLVGSMKAVDSVSDIVRGLFQYRERMDLSSVSLMIKGPASLLALATAVWMTGSIVVASAATAIVWGASFATYDLTRASRLLTAESKSAKHQFGICPRFQLDVLARLTWTALPLGIVMAVISLQVNIPRYVLQSHAGSALLGYFGAIVYPMMAGMMVTTAMGQAASTRLARRFADDPKGFVGLLGKLSAISATMAVVLIAGTCVLGDRVLWLLYGREYAAYHREFLVVSVALGIQLVSSCWGYGLTAARCFRVQVGLTGVSCIATAVAAFALIPGHGVMGAALSVLVTTVTMAIGFAAAMFWAVRARWRRGAA